MAPSEHDLEWGASSLLSMRPWGSAAQRRLRCLLGAPLRQRMQPL